MSAGCQGVGWSVVAPVNPVGQRSRPVGYDIIPSPRGALWVTWVQVSQSGFYERPEPGQECECSQLALKCTPLGRNLPSQSGTTIYTA